MARTSGVRRNENVKLRQTITDMMTNIENVMSNIHIVLGDMGVLVKQIDSITSRLESKYEQKRSKSNILLDANKNQYEIVETPGFSNQSKLPSPFIDYTYLDLADDCEMCGQNVQNLKFNEKYPLWIQCDTWKTGNTGNSPSDLSIVSAGSDNSDALHSGSDGCSQSWKSISNFGPYSYSKEVNNFRRERNSSDFQAKLLRRYSECCKTGSVQNDAYCGVYEEIMEAHLDDIGPVLQDDTGFDIHDSFSDDLTSGDSIDSRTSFSMSDEHIIHFNKVSNTWTAFKLTDVTVREFSDSNSSID